MNDQMAKLKLLQQIPLRRFVKDLDWAFTDSAIGQTYHIHLVLQDDSILKLQTHSSDDLIRKANLDLEQYAEKQGWIEPTPVDVLQREEVKNYIIGTSKDFDSSAQVHFVRLTLQDGAISSGMHPNPMIAEEKATIAAIEYSIKKGWIEKVSPYCSFSKALELLKQGQKICRKGWNGKGMWLSYLDPYHNNQFSITEKDGAEGTFSPYIGMKTADNKYVPWLASQTDLLADDWMIAE